MKGGERSNWPHPHPTLSEKSTLKSQALLELKWVLPLKKSQFKWGWFSDPVYDYIPFFVFYPISTLIKLVSFNFYLFQDFFKLFYTTPSIAYI